MAKAASYELQVVLGGKTSHSFKSAINQAEEALSGLDSISNVAMAGMAATAAASATAIASAISNATDTYKGFESEIKTVQSISGASASEFLALKEAAMDAGRTTVFTATEAAEALEYTSLAGWSVQESIAGMPGIMKMTAATGKELKTTSDLLTDSMSALSIGVDGLDTYMDKLIQTNNKANTNSEQLMEALIGSGGAAKTLGVSLDDTITSLGVFANNGLKGTEAGTALNAIFVRLAGNTQAIKELSELNVDIWDDNGQFIGFEQTLERINVAMAELTSEEKAMSLKKIAGVNYYSEMAYLLDSVNSQDGQNSAFANLKTQIEGSQGALDAMYETTTDTLDVAEKLFESAKEDMQIQFVDVFSDDAKEFIKWMAEKLPVASEALVDFAEAHQGDFEDILKNAENGIETLWDKGIAAGEWIIKNKKSISGALTTFAGGIALIKGVTVGLSIAKSLTNPITAAGVAILGGVTAFGAIRGAIQDAEDAARDANLAEHFGEVNLSLEELDTLARQIVGEDSLNGVASMLKSAAETASAIEAVTDVWTELQKNSWKVNVGFHMDTDDYEAYGQSIEKYISAVEDYAEDKGYEVHIATTLLFGEGSTQNMESNEFFTGIQKRLEQYGDKLYDYLYDKTNGALLDGIIDVEEDVFVQEYLSKISNITAAISEAENAAKLESLTLKYNGADLTPEDMTQLQEDIGEYIGEIQEGAQQAYESAMTEYHARLALDPAYTQADFDADSAEAWEAYYKIQADSAMNGIDYMLDTLHEAYPELQSNLEQYQDDLNGIIEEYMDPDNISAESWIRDKDFIIANMKDEAYEVMKNNHIAEDRAALEQYLEQMKPTADAVSEVWSAYEAEGKEIPEEMQEFREQWELLQNQVGNNKEQATIDMWNVASQNDSFNDFLNNYGIQVDDASMYISKKSEELANTATNSTSGEKRLLTNPVAYEAYHPNMPTSDTWNEIVEQRIGTGWRVFSDEGLATYKQNAKIDIENLYTWTDEQIKTFFANNDYSVAARVNLDLEPTLMTASLGMNRYYNQTKIYHNARGGIYDKPILTTFAEEGAEAAIPLDGSDRAKRLWEQTGEMLGMLPTGSRDGALLAGVSNGKESPGSSNIQLSFSPNITIKGNAEREDVQQALAISMEELKEMLIQIQREDARVAFG